jgi:glycine/D-amino acid oxidase-like deaminating enzyme
MAMHRSNRIVIVGGGIAGLAIAARLAQAGLPVTVLEASRLGQGASTRNQGWLHSGGWFAPEHPEVARLCYESLQQTLRFCPECVEADSPPMTYIISQQETDPDRWTSAWDAAGIPVQRLTPKDLSERPAGLAISQVRHAFELPDRSIRTDRLLGRLAEIAQQAGAEIRSETAVSRLVQHAGSVQGVATSRGEVLLAGLVILAGNASGGSLLPGYGAEPVGAGAEVALVALKTHLVAVRPSLSRWPFCVIDGDGFNHLPHHPYSVFGSNRWLAARHGADDQVIAAEIQRIQDEVKRFFPDFKPQEHQTSPWAGVTAQAMHLDQIRTTQVPLPTVIDHSQEGERTENLMSVFPGRATLWAHLAEKTAESVLKRLDTPRQEISRPAWDRLADSPRSSH